MTGPKLLIVDDNEDFRLALAAHLAKQYTVSSCGNGREALLLLKNEPFQYLVLDVLLPEIDGITLLHRILQEHVHPKTLLLTPLINDYILDSAEGLGVGYLIRKPCTLQAVADRIGDLKQLLHAPVFSEVKVSALTELLLKLSFLPKHKGFPCIKEAILQLETDPEQGLTKELYPAVARYLDRSANNVERTIRSAIVYAWNHRNPLVWDTYFPGCTECPTNSAFLATMAEVLGQLEE